MTDQPVNPEGAVTLLPATERLPNGKFAPGNKAGAGCNRNKGWQPISQRYIALGEKYSRQELVDMANDESLAQEKLSYWDSFAIQRMARAVEKKLTETDSGADQCLKEANAILDRLEGKPVETVNTNTSPPITQEDLENMTSEEVARAVERLSKL
jgi:hypothetical protein